MAHDLKRCPVCNGRGSLRCECWPGDCICGWDDEPCDECGGEGWIDPFYDDDFADVLEDRQQPARCQGQIIVTAPYIAGVVSVMHTTPCTAPSVITVDGRRMCKDCYSKMEMKE